jgi:hypothetical protein
VQETSILAWLDLALLWLAAFVSFLVSCQSHLPPDSVHFGLCVFLLRGTAVTIICDS